MGESNPCSPGMSPFCWTDIPLLPVGWVKPRLTPWSKGSEPLQEGLVPLPRKVWLHHSHHVSCLQTHPRALGEAGDDADGGWRTTRDPRQRQKEMCPGNSLLGCSSTVLTVFPASKITPKHWRWCKVWLEGQGRDPRQSGKKCANVIYSWAAPAPCSFPLLRPELWLNSYFLEMPNASSSSHGGKKWVDSSGTAHTHTENPGIIWGFLAVFKWDQVQNDPALMGAQPSFHRTDHPCGEDF